MTQPGRLVLPAIQVSIVPFPPGHLLFHDGERIARSLPSPLSSTAIYVISPGWHTVARPHIVLTFGALWRKPISVALSVHAMMHILMV